MTPTQLAALDAICAALNDLAIDLRSVPTEEHEPYLGALSAMFRAAARLDTDIRRAEHLEEVAGMALIVHEDIKLKRRERRDIN